MTQTSGTPEQALFEIAESVHRYARRWAVGQSHDPEHAIVYDAAVTLVHDTFPHRRLGGRPDTAVHDRYLRFGPETITNPFSIPVAVEDAVAVLHAFARRYTNGRGSYTASIVNDAARELLRLGVSLDRTIASDGTYWAADGVDGSHDGLTPEQRAEALGALPQSG